MTDDWKRSNYNTALDAMRRNEGAFDPAEAAQDYIARKRYRTVGIDWPTVFTWVGLISLGAGILIGAWRIF